MDDQACENTDREIWREHEGDFYSDSIHVTKSGGIGINCGGIVYVMPVRDWHHLASERQFPTMAKTLASMGPACACCKQQPKPDCDVPGCAFRGYEGYKAASEDCSDGERISSLEKALECRTTERNYHMRMADKLAERVRELESALRLTQQLERE